MGVFLTTMVNKKPIMLDHEVLESALKLSTSQLKLANVDISKDFVFNKNEFRLYRYILCEHEVPPDMFVEDRGISFELFSPIFQTLALIIRGNIYPITSNNKLVLFAETKLMYKLAGHKVHFNLAYLILLQMINGFKKGYMFYGLLLTKVFEHFKLNVSTVPYFPVESIISDKAKRVVVPLPGFALVPPAPPTIINLDPIPPTSVGPGPQDSFDVNLAKLQAAHDDLAESFKNLQEAFNQLAAKFEFTEASL
ncbi:hypothetical protein AgCh_023703 [Apium graveolens]